MTTTAHTHRADPKQSRTLPFGGPVRREGQVPAAHGNVCVVDRCRCGAERRTNTNGRHTERGPWIDA